MFSLSNFFFLFRERQEFDLMIERQMRKKSEHQNKELELFSDLVS